MAASSTETAQATTEFDPVAFVELRDELRGFADECRTSADEQKKRTDELESRLDELKSELDELKSILDELKSILDELKNRLNGLERDYELPPDQHSPHTVSAFLAFAFAT